MNEPNFEPKQTSDANLPKHQQGDTPAPNGTHISEKVYLAPESFNQLRKELCEHWPNLWKIVGWHMAFNAPQFCYSMDEALGLISQFDTSNVDGICKRYLDELRFKRGLSRLHQPSEYYVNTVMQNNVQLARDVHENTAPFTPRKKS